MTRVLIVIVLLAQLLAGCAPRISAESYAKLEDGMTLEQVVAILGEPSESSSLGIGSLSGTLATWEGEGVTIQAQFVNGKLASKQLLQRGE